MQMAMRVVFLAERVSWVLCGRLRCRKHVPGPDGAGRGRGSTPIKIGDTMSIMPLLAGPTRDQGR